MGAGICLAFVGGRASAGPSHREAGRVIVVRPGDTVWSIAQRVVGPQGDPRPVVQRIVQRNRLTDAVITAGERIRLPAG